MDKNLSNNNNPENNSENGVNLSDFAGENNDLYFANGITDDYSLTEVQKAIRERKQESAVVQKKSSREIKGTYIFFIVVIVVSMLLSIYAILCINDVLAITKNKSSVTVSYTEEIDSVDDAVDLLHDSGLIKCKNFCKLFAKYRDYTVGPPYSAGVYYLNGKMGLEGMLLTMHGDTSTSETVTITFYEGMTTPEIIDKLVDNEVCDKSALLSVISSTEFSYSLTSSLKAKETVPYRLEGYLFPDTYEFYVGESASSVVKKFLANMEDKYPQEYRDRAKKLGLSDYEVLTIASIIQKEAANSEQMKRISSVVHNRLNDTTNYPSIGCESTDDYITNFVADSLSSTSAHTADYYLNYYSTKVTSSVVGLPAGPICNPGVDAIEAALYPESTDYYFFFHDSDGELYCSSTYSENKAKIAKYAPYLG